MKEGAGKTGCRPGTHGPLCERWQQESAQRHTGGAKHPAFPAQWLYGLCRALPGERCTIAPVVPRDSWCARPVGPPHHRWDLTHRPRASGPHDFAVRWWHRSYARGLAHGLPPCKAVRANAICVHCRPARVR